MANSLDALRGLSANDPISLRMMQQKRLDEMKRNRELAAMPVSPSTQYSFGGPKLGPNLFGTGATNADVQGLETDLEEDPFTGQAEQDRNARFNNTTDEVDTYNRPDVAAMRGHQQQDALERVLAPIREKGKYDVEAAHALSGGRADLADQNNTARMALEDKRQTGMGERVGLQGRVVALRQERDKLTATGSKRTHMPLSGVSGFFGIGHDEADAKRVAEIDAELASLGEHPEAPVSNEAPNPGAAMAARIAAIKARNGIN